MLQIQEYLLTREEYRKLTKASRQSVHNKIKRGTLKTRICKEEKEVERIVLTPEEYETITPKMQVVIVDSVNDKD